MRFEAASKETCLDLAEKKAKLLVHVSGEASRDERRFVEAVMPKSCQLYQRGKRSDGGAYYSSLWDFACGRSEGCRLSQSVLGNFLKLRDARASSNLWL